MTVWSMVVWSIPFRFALPRLALPERTGTLACKHPHVKVVSREEDTEFVECLECGDVFESSEFKDMEIEEQEAGKAKDEE